MDKNELKLTSAEIGSLWAEYVNGTAVDIVNHYMLSIVEDEEIQTLFKDAIKTFEKQKKKIAAFMENEGFPVPIGFTESDLNKGTKRLFSDIFCLNYLHIITTHGILGHTTALNVAARKDLRHFFDGCNNDGKTMYHQTIELLMEKGHFQRDPYFYPEANATFIEGQKFMDGFFGDKRPLAATEIISLSFNLKKNIMHKTLSMGFSQVTRSKEVKKFLRASEENADDHIQTLAKIMQGDNLPVPKSWETEITESQDSPFSDKLILFHVGFLIQSAQNYHGAGLASAMRSDLVLHYERFVTKDLRVLKEWFNLMTKNKWLEQPPLAPDRKQISKNK